MVLDAFIVKRFCCAVRPMTLDNISFIIGNGRAGGQLARNKDTCLSGVSSIVYTLMYTGIKLVNLR